MSRPPHLLDALRDTVLLCDGGMGSRVQSMTLDVDRDFHGKENCTDVLNLSRPDLVRDIHRGYFEAGADMVETNTFGGSPVTLAEFDIADRAFEINKRGGELAREAAEQFADGRHRWVIGSVGPGTKLPSLGHIAYDPLEEALTLQCRGLIAGGVDAILIETCQDPLQIKAAVNGAKIARAEAGSDIPIFVQVTVETTGTLLVGADIAAAATIVHALDVPMIGLNCATGPQEMAEHVRWLAENWPGPALGAAECRPAGTGRRPDALSARPGGARPAGWSASSSEDGVNLIGGCCGTNAQHIAALDEMLRRRAEGSGHPRPVPVARKSVWMPSVATLYQAVPLRQENAFFAIGERCNANGSRKLREAQEKHDWDGCVEMGREQVGEGSHALDVCTAFVGRDEIAEMNEVIRRFTSVGQRAAGDRLHRDAGARSGAEALWRQADHQLDQLRGRRGGRGRPAEAGEQFGAAVIALTIDETGMAKTVEPSSRSRGGWSISPATSMACRSPIC